MMTQGQVLTSDPAKVVWGHWGHQQVFAANLRLRRARDMKVVSMCLSSQYASTDMQLGSSRDLDLRSNFDLDLSRSCYTCIGADWRGEHDGVKIIALSSQAQKLSLKNCFAQKWRFDLSWPLTLKRLILGEIWRHLSERAFQELSFALNGFGVAIIVPEIMADNPDKTIIFRKYDFWWPLLTTIFTSARKWPKWLRTGSLRAVDCRIAQPFSLPSFRVRRGHFAPPPTMAKVAEIATRGRVTKLTFALLGGVWTPPPCGFSRIARKRRRAAPPGFHLPYPPSVCQLLWKFRSWVMQGQVTRSGQVTILYKNFAIAPQLQCLRESYETFGIW